MFNNYLFYRCYPDRGMASEGDPMIVSLNYYNPYPFNII